MTVFVNDQQWDAEGVKALVRLPEIVDSLPGSSSRSSNRITVWNWTPDWCDEPGFVVRQFVHGGLLQKLTGEWFWGTDRFQREMRLALHAVQNDVPTCRPVALRTERVMGPFHTGYYVTERIPRSLNLLELCRRANRSKELDPALRRRLAEHIAASIAAMHDARIVHADLNLKNILLKNAWSNPEAYIIDLDRAELRSEVPLADRLDNLVRLDRSVLKWPASRETITLQDRIRTWKRYLARYPGWSRRWRELFRRNATRHLRHMLTRR